MQKHSSSHQNSSTLIRCGKVSINSTVAITIIPSRLPTKAPRNAYPTPTVQSAGFNILSRISRSCFSEITIVTILYGQIIPRQQDASFCCRTVVVLFFLVFLSFLLSLQLFAVCPSNVQYQFPQRQFVPLLQLAPLLVKTQKNILSSTRNASFYYTAGSLSMSQSRSDIPVGGFIGLSLPVSSSTLEMFEKP